MRTGAKTRETTGDLIRALIAERKTSVRGLSRTLAEPDEGNTAESWRRSLHRYLAGDEPTENVASEMEARLQLPAGYFPRTNHGQARELRRALETRVAELERAVAEARRDRKAQRGNLEHLAETIERLGQAVALLAEAQRPALRARLLDVLAEEQE